MIAAVEKLQVDNTASGVISLEISTDLNCVCIC